MADKTYNVQTAKRHTFCVDFRMTISFLLDEGGRVDGDYPVYILESTDGSYYLKLSAGTDLVADGDYMQLQFKKLGRGKSYKLTRQLSEDLTEVVFDDIPFATIVDQNRDAHQILEDHKYGELEVDPGSTVDAICWQPVQDDDQSGEATQGA